MELILENCLAPDMLLTSFADLLVPGCGFIRLLPTFGDLLVLVGDLLQPGCGTRVWLLQLGCGTRLWFLIMLVGCSSLISFFSPEKNKN